MQHDTEPDYKKCRSILISGVQSCGNKVDDPLLFATRATPKRKSNSSLRGTPDKQRKLPKKSNMKIQELCDEEEDKPKKDTKGKENVENEARKKAGRSKKKIEKELSGDEKMEIDEPVQHGFTAEMMRVMKRIEENKKPKTKTKRIALKASDSSASSSKKSSVDLSDTEIIEATPTPPRNSKKKAIHQTNETTPVTPTRSSARSKKAVFYGSDYD